MENFRVPSLLWKVLQIHPQEKNPNLKTPVDNVSSNTALSLHCRCNSTVALYAGFKSVSELVDHYHRKQAEDRQPKTQPKVGKPGIAVKEMPRKLFSVRFCLKIISCK